MDVQRVDPEDRRSCTVIVALGGFQLWVMPARESSFDPPTDRTVAMWVHDDGTRIRFLRSFNPPRV